MIVGLLDFFITNVSPPFRFVIVSTFVLVGCLNVYIMNEIFDETYITMDGVKKVYSGNVEIVHIADILSNVFQLLVCFYCAARVIQVPHVAEKKVKSFFQKFVWDSHEAIFLLIASTVNSNRLVEHLFESDFISTVYKDEDIEIVGFVMNDEKFHYLVERVIFFIRLFLMTLGVVFLFINVVIRGNNSLIKNRPSGVKILEYIIPTIYYSVVLFYTMRYIIDFHQDTLEKQYPAELPEHMKNRRFEFIIENIGNVFIPLACIMFTWVEDEQQMNQLASMFVFNTIIVGFYAMCITVKISYSMYYLDGNLNTYWFIILLYFACVVGVIAVRVLQRENLKKTLFDMSKSFYYAVGGNTAPVAVLWRLGVVLGIIGFILAIMSTQAQWFTFEVKPGKIPINVSHVVGNVTHDVEDFGDTILSAVKKLDPCRWVVGDTDNQHVNSTIDTSFPSYNGNPAPEFHKSSFDMNNFDMRQGECKCSGKSNCPCDYINDIKSDHVITKEKQKSAANSNDIAKVHDEYSKFSEIPDDSTYVQNMKECHATECSAVLGVAIASELAITLDALESFFLPGSGLVAEAAWWAQKANRIGHGVVTMGLSIAKMLYKLENKINFFKPLVLLLEKLAMMEFKVSYKMSFDLLLVYVPVLVNGFFCILIGFWKRNNVNKFLHNISIMTTFYIPLFFVNISMIGLLYVFPVIINDICNIFRSGELITVTPSEHAGFSILRWSYIFSTAGAFVLMCASLLDDAYYFRKKILGLRQLLKSIIEPASKSTRTVSTSVNIYDIVDNGWLQAFIISFPVLFFILASYHYEWVFTVVNYGPSGTLLSVVSSFHGHTNIIQDATTIKDDSTEGLCGLIGKGVEILTKEILKDIEIGADFLVRRLELFVDSVFHLSSVITGFKDAGKVGVDILDSVWTIAEKSIVLIIPTCVTLLMLVAVLGLPKITDIETRKSTEKTVKQMVLMGIYYNVILIVMMQQLFATISNINLYLFYFQFDPGFLVTLGYIASGLNAMSLFSLYVQNMYPVEIVEE